MFVLRQLRGDAWNSISSCCFSIQRLFCGWWCAAADVTPCGHHTEISTCWCWPFALPGPFCFICSSSFLSKLAWLLIKLFRSLSPFSTGFGTSSSRQNLAAATFRLTILPPGATVGDPPPPPPADPIAGAVVLRSTPLSLRHNSASVFPFLAVPSSTLPYCHTVLWKD